VARRVLDHPADIARIVGGEAQLAAIDHRRGEEIERCRRDDAALVVAQLRPGIGKEDEDAGQYRLGQRRQEQPRIVYEEPDIADVLPLDVGKQLDDAVLEDLAADKALARRRRGLRRQMLAGAKADLERDRLGRRGEQRGRVEAPLRRQRDGEPRQQRRQQVLLSRAELAAAAAAIKDAPAERLFAQKAPRSALTRSSCSQEKPPSGSGGRPKWP
jgi:hypothetical protein